MPQLNAGALFCEPGSVNPIPSIQIHGESASKPRALQR
ncbi:hypothetical protein SynNOUM97013_01550 [Synechococcus sp. NOUM97013]|nr:hypothetical protein SynNOUM97013_01550 [Synechococcus sp. NOUM97013]